MRPDPKLFHIGDIIAERIDARGMTKAEFGRRLNISRQHVNTLLNKHHLTVCQLVAMSNVLQHDFLQYYLEMLPDNLSKQPKRKVQPPEQRTLLMVEIKVDAEIVERLEALGKQK